jgi:hypothetical protein
MTRTLRQEELEAAFDSIEEMILPGISMMLETLLEAAANSRPGIDAAVYAAELRTIGAQLEALVREVEGLSQRAEEPVTAEARSAA